MKRRLGTIRGAGTPNQRRREVAGKIMRFETYFFVSQNINISLLFFLLIAVVISIFLIISYRIYKKNELPLRDFFAVILALLFGFGFFGNQFLETKASINKIIHSNGIKTVEGNIANFRKIGMKKELSFDVKDTSFSIKSVHPFDGFNDWSDRSLRDGLYVRIKYLPYYNKEEGVRNKIIQIDVRQ
ncbi:hypothetical protein [Rhodomicrobium lacus]|uniref:hypothetical protein n=1 Tax=Rhodomicrobium lacus TaxID=2498452 RepID=UPI000F8E4262|nr:hypothetical protein [Rhodomicrobium lacus]